MLNMGFFMPDETRIFICHAYTYTCGCVSHEIFDGCQLREYRLGINVWHVAATFVLVLRTNKRCSVTNCSLAWITDIPVYG